LEFTVGQMTEDDIPSIRAMGKEFGIFDEEQVKKFISEKQNIAFAAKLGGVCIGLIYGYTLTRMDMKKPQFFIYSVDIFPEYQDKGYGSRFVRHVVDWAKDNGHSETFVLTDKDNSRACRVYEKAGMTHSEKDCERMYVIEYDNSL